jgi:SIR2-like domain
MATTQHPGFRIFILGAGFSRPAGLPVATELYPAVKALIEGQHGTETKFDRDVGEYLRYCDDCGVGGQTKDSLDLEMLMSYLDIEHYLELRGSDTWSREGNESQLMIRKAIGKVIHDRTPDKLPDCYLRFAEMLSPRDIVLTFNYDLVLEAALAHVGKRFRRYPHRFKTVNAHGGTLDSDTEEVILLKLHGSLDWFDDSQFLDLRASLQAQSVPKTSLHSVFDEPERYGAKPLVDGLLPPSDPLAHLHAIQDVSSYYAKDGGFNAPFILSPSHVKFVYASPIMSLWNGLGRAGAYNLGVSVIGFSLPPHDEYIRIGMHQMLRNYASWWDNPMLGALKDYVRFVDFKTDQAEKDAYTDRYRFAGADRSKFYFGGFGPDSLEFLFNQPRTS